MVTFVAKGVLVPLDDFTSFTELVDFSLLLGGVGSVTAHTGVIHASPYVIHFTGNFQFIPADPTTALPETFLGTVTSISSSYNGQPHFTLTGLNIALPELIAAAGDSIPVEADIFKGNDLIVGGALGDSLRGYGGNDTILGKGGVDALWGDSGNDLLDGGPGANSMFGGPGHDIFRRTAAINGANFDDILDFHHGIDKIHLHHTSVPGLPLGALLAADFHIGISAMNHHQEIIYDKTTGTLYFDHDGSGSGTQVAFASVYNGANPANLTAFDFHIF